VKGPATNSEVRQMSPMRKQCPFLAVANAAGIGRWPTNTCETDYCALWNPALDCCGLKAQSFPTTKHSGRSSLAAVDEADFIRWLRQSSRR
jgi:hypothetical protein